jgi:hypothetical protein
MIFLFIVVGVLCTFSYHLFYTLKVRSAQRQCGISAGSLVGITQDPTDENTVFRCWEGAIRIDHPSSGPYLSDIWCLCLIKQDSWAIYQNGFIADFKSSYRIISVARATEEDEPFL